MKKESYYEYDFDSHKRHETLGLYGVRSISPQK